MGRGIGGGGEMKERPIIFSGDSVRAIIAGRKTQTRRVVFQRYLLCNDPAGEVDNADIVSWCPYGASGDRLWVREKWAFEDFGEEEQRIVWAADLAAAWIGVGHSLGKPFYLSSDYTPSRWRPSIHMPAWASQLTLEVVNVRVQRLQDISEVDAKAEGVEYRAPFVSLWNTINAKRGFPWSANPWVWAVTFKRVDE